MSEMEIKKQFILWLAGKNLDFLLDSKRLNLVRCLPQTAAVNAAFLHLSGTGNISAILDGLKDFLSTAPVSPVSSVGLIQ